MIIDFSVPHVTSNHSSHSTISLPDDEMEDDKNDNRFPLTFPTASGKLFAVAGGQWVGDWAVVRENHKKQRCLSCARYNCRHCIRGGGDETDEILSEAKEQSGSPIPEKWRDPTNLGKLRAISKSQTKIESKVDNNALVIERLLLSKFMMKESVHLRDDKPLGSQSR